MKLYDCLKLLQTSFVKITFCTQTSKRQNISSSNHSKYLVFKNTQLLSDFVSKPRAFPDVLLQYLAHKKIKILLCLWRPLPHYGKYFWHLRCRTDQYLMATRAAWVKEGQL